MPALRYGRRRGSMRLPNEMSRVGTPACEPDRPADSRPPRIPWRRHRQEEPRVTSQEITGLFDQLTIDLGRSGSHSPAAEPIGSPDPPSGLLASTTLHRRYDDV